jgi:hypothetical protein
MPGRWDNRLVPQDPVATASPGTPEVVRYAEVLRVPLRWWALSTMFHVTLFVAFAVALPVLVAVVAVLVLVLVSSAWFLGYGSARVVVTDHVFRAGRAQIAVSWLADPRALDGEETWRAAGPGADARAWLVLRPYLRESVMVQVTDPADPVPYWLVATRRPEQLTAALRAVVPADRAPDGAPDRARDQGRGVSGEGHRAE